MLKKIESLRKQPTEVRNRYAFWWALGFTVLIAFFWLMSIPSKLSVFTQTEPVEEQERVQGGFSRSLSELRTSITGGIDTFRQIKGEAKTLKMDTSDDADALNFSTFFGSTTPGKREEDPVAKQVLIGTSSASKATSTQ